MHAGWAPLEFRASAHRLRQIGYGLRFPGMLRLYAHDAESNQAQQATGTGSPILAMVARGIHVDTEVLPYLGSNESLENCICIRLGAVLRVVRDASVRA